LGDWGQGQKRKTQKGEKSKDETNGRGLREELKKQRLSPHEPGTKIHQASPVWPERE